ncbi:hypothetical protein C0992_005164 [Termitomyces sp. T32_za158]|nr:hypothetical protein C0992_005164 [Termitomyces sp. T32_za158]
MRLSILLFTASALARAPAGPWDAFNYAPSSKTVYPASIHSSHGTVTDAPLLVNNSGPAMLAGNGSWVALDFGIEVGGLVSLTISNVPAASLSLALSFTESPSFIRSAASDDSSFPDASTTYDGVLRIPGPLAPGHWTQPASSLRGGFRFLTITLLDSDAQITLANVSCSISFMPHVSDLRAYSGYFYAPDPGFADPDFLTKGASSSSCLLRH